LRAAGISMDQLESYGAAKWGILPDVAYRQHRNLNNREENSHQPSQQRARRIQNFKSAGHARHFPDTYGPMVSHFLSGATSSLLQNTAFR
jgi:transposase-like protein